MIVVTSLLLATLQTQSGQEPPAQRQPATPAEVRGLAAQAVEGIRDTADARRVGFVPFFHEEVGGSAGANRGARRGPAGRRAIGE